MDDNPRGGRREARGLWAWKLETLDPGTSTTVTFAVGGLSKGDWTEVDIFFRGAGDIIGATKLDEAILAEMLREEEVGSESDDEVDPVEESTVEETQEITEVSQEMVSVESDDDSEGQSDWFGLGGGEEE